MAIDHREKIELVPEFLMDDVKRATVLHRVLHCVVCGLRVEIKARSQSLQKKAYAVRIEVGYEVNVIGVTRFAVYRAGPRSTDGIRDPGANKGDSDLLKRFGQRHAALP